MRTLLAPVLLGGALAAGTAAPSADVAAQNPITEARQEEDPLLAKLRQEISSLIADLDSEKYQVREKAQRRLEQLAVGWVLEKQRVFPLVTALAPKGVYSLEQQRRLGKILDAHEREELQLLWRPTIFREPPEWKGRKDAPTVREVLAALEKQTGQRIHLEQSKEFADGAVTGKLDGRTSWEILERLRQPAGGKCDIYRLRDGSLRVYAEDHGVYAMEGSVLGRAYTRQHGHPLDPERKIDVNFLTEIALGDAFITEAIGVTDKGRKCTLAEKSMMEGWSRTPESETHLVMSFEEGEQSIDLTVTVVLRGYETRVETLKNLAKSAKFPVGSYELQILGASKSTEAWPAYWSIDAQLLGGEDEYEWQRLVNAMQCRAFDAMGRPIAASGFSSSASGFGWQFHAEPHSIELVLPGRCTTSEKTLLFKGIPLD
ncbi:hypothetical protein HY464_00115 [Candidatus Peregrinibacteria bacterium]|nr:hypothetical protein [Candidatus Peregrinibacteria bacterium]MBI4129076.1 hypothetical protein [Candidatus Peregrinibacteria bacterium]